MYLFGGKRIQGVQLPESLQEESPSDIQSDNDDDNQMTDAALTPKVNSDATSDPLETDELDASCNQVDAIPPSLMKYDHLAHLNLSESNIAFIDPNLYRSYPRLEILILSMNSIQEIPDDMPTYLPHLKVLHLDRNRITSLPDSIGQWNQMQDLKLGSEFGGNLLEEIPETLSEMIELVHLDLSHNRIQTVPFLQDMSQLRHLNLSHNQLRQVPDLFLSRCPRLETVDVSHNQIASLPQDFVDNMLYLSEIKLGVLNLSNNRICILPLELLDQPRIQVFIRGNPLIQLPSGQQQQRTEHRTVEAVTQGYLQAVQRFIQRAIPTSSYSQPVERHATEQDPGTVQEDDINTSLESQIPARSEAEGGLAGTLPDDDGDDQVATGFPSTVWDDTDIDDEHDQPYLIHSLQEIALRNTALFPSSVLSLLPGHLASAIENKTKSCLICKRPYIHEWVSTIQLKRYQGYSSTVSKVKFCSTGCWQRYRENIRERAMQMGNENPQRRALEYVRQQGNPLQPGSIEWIMAAVTASREQDEQMEVMANML
ncbi:hypothetical protein G6F43_007861 [Rhizopus delemar]|nr:hypothetical protein G6F43_007861 [Rhizopus delemar]